jgi:hypothetical protein
MSRADALSLVPKIMAETGSPALSQLLSEIVTNSNGLILNQSTRSETLVAARTVKAEESGMTFFLGVAGGFTVTLPAPARGLRYTFIVSVSPTTAYIIATNGGADIGVIGVNELEVDTSDDGPYDVDADAISFVANVAVIGDYLDFWCDGTKWYARGQTNADGGITSATT